MLDYYREKYGYQPLDFPNSYLADRLSLALPLYPQMTEQEHSYVIENLHRHIPMARAA
jgi:dTDP-4-amino-4,6-dideoxygalactose transaminase